MHYNVAYSEFEISRIPCEIKYLNPHTWPYRINVTSTDAFSDGGLHLTT